MLSLMLTLIQMNRTITKHRWSITLDVHYGNVQNILQKSTPQL